jgi:phosphoribosyl 1,2-cyclic phosphate phosphodiesterase
VKVIFLGTGTSAGVPLVGCNCEVCTSADPRDQRLRCSVYIEAEGLKIVIDIGPDFRQQLLREHIRTIDAILITHPHRDHIGGLDEVRALNFTSRKAIDIYCDELSEKGIRELHPYVFAKSDYPYLPQVNFKRIYNAPFWINHLEILPIEVMHAQMPVKGFRIGNFAYITDCKTIAPSEAKKLRNLDVLVLNALRDEEHYSHLTFKQAIELAGVLKPKKTYFIHMSHQAGKHDMRQAQLPKNFFLAYDRLQLNI